jgi:Uma2 family endonuclease
MSTRAPTQPIASPATPSIVPSYRMTADEFERVSEGLDKPAELIDGQLVERPDMNPEHAVVTELLRQLLDPILKGKGWYVREEKPVRVDEYNERLPDISVVPGSPRDYFKRHPKPGIAALLVEVSWSTQAYDRGEKRDLYAAQGVPVYWLVDLKARKVEVYNLTTSGTRYGEPSVHQDGDSVPVVIDDKEIGRIAVTAILPPDPAAAGNGA